jgi:hypothetical protein
VGIRAHRQHLDQPLPQLVSACGNVCSCVCLDQPQRLRKCVFIVAVMMCMRYTIQSVVAHTFHVLSVTLAYGFSECYMLW